MKPKLNLLIAAGLAAAGFVSSAQEAAKVEATPAASAEVMPISIEDAQLPDAIRTLARQAGININIDPKAFAAAPGPDGKVPPPPSVSFRWENLTAMQALQAVLDNNNLQMVADPKNKVSRITTKDPAALEPLISKVIKLRFSNSTNSIPVLQSVFASPRSKIIADVRTSHLVILATEKELTQVEAIVKQIDVSPAQILIEAKFFESSKNPKTSKGIDWTDTLSAQRIKYGNYSTFTTGLEPKPPTGIPGTPTFDPGFPGAVSGVLAAPAVVANNHSGFGGVGYLNADGLNVVLSFLNSDNDTDLLATPRAVALEGVDTDLSVVQNIPIFEQETPPATAGGSQPANTIKPVYDKKVGDVLLSEVGVKLIVTPRIFGETNVFMSLKPEISDQGVDAKVTIDGKTTTSPTFNRRRLTTQSMVPSGNTLVLGGLNNDVNSKTSTKVPILGDIPGLGWAFRSEGKSRDKKTLIIFVTPTILGLSDYQDGEKSREFMKSKVEDKPDTDWSSWDSATPHDWSKPSY